MSAKVSLKRKKGNKSSSQAASVEKQNNLFQRRKLGLKPCVHACLYWFLPGKLVLAESQYIAPDLSHYLALILSSAMFQNVLDYIVAILVLNKTKHTDTLAKT